MTNAIKSLKTEQKESIKDYIRVATTYFRVSEDETGRDLIKWNKETIKDDFGSKANPNPHNKVKKYIDFCNEPDNLHYRQEINNRFNVYAPLTHIPLEGNCDTILNFLHHLSKDTENITKDTHSILLDYLTLLYRNPKHTLPILGLQSNERGTGKSTFLYLLREIFQSNAVVLNNESFQKSFNAHYATRLIIGIDEMWSNEDKKQQIERIKEMVTAKKAILEYKGVDGKEVDNYKKLIMCFNDPENLWIPREETRYFILRVKPFKRKDANGFNKMIKEIPAFLHLLKNRNLSYPEPEGRAWFPDEVLDTDILLEIKKNSDPFWKKTIDAYIQDAFESFEVNELHYSVQDIFQEIKARSKYTIDQNQIKKYFTFKGMKTIYQKTGKQEHYKFHSLYAYDGHNPDVGYKPNYKKGSYYTFHREEWMMSLLDNDIVQKNEAEKEPPF